jgi:acylphosphatase
MDEMPERPRERIRVRIVVSGRVQGVGFRYATVREARRLGLGGWARNRTDGCVEILADGAPARVDELLAWCRSGPPAAHVTRVEQCAVEPGEPFADFGVRG